MTSPRVLLLTERAPVASLESGWTRVDVPDATSLARTAARAWYWPEAKNVLARVASAIRFESTAEAPTPLDAALLATERAASVARDTGVLAVLWETTGLVHDAASFVDQSADASREDPPLYLWIAFEGTKDEGGTLGMRTTGLAALGAMEVEVEGSKRDGEHILECVTDIALFLLTGDPVPDDGETIEITHGALRVRRMRSLRGDGTIALRVRV